MRRFLLLVLGTFALSNLVGWLALDSLLHRVAAGPAFHWLASAFFVLQGISLVAFFLVRLLQRQPGYGLGRPLLSLVMIWDLIFALPTAVIFLLWAVIWRLAIGPVGDDAAAGAGRTVASILMAVPFALTLLATVVAQWQLRRFRIRRIELALPNLPEALKGLTIAHLSDFHVGMLTTGKVLEDIVAATNRLDADLILLTGDLINMAMEDLPRSLDMLRRLKSRYGLYSCEGNHDLIENRSEFEAAVKVSGLPFLLNESATVSIKGQPTQILGLRWGEALGDAKETPGSPPTGALHELLARRAAGDFTILLAHHPEVFDAAARAGIPLTLAGHTHGGQLMLSEKYGFGPWLYRYWSGVYTIGVSRLVVSNGVGNWFPLRTHAPAEIIHLTLT